MICNTEFNRRQFLSISAAGLATATFAPRPAFAQEDAMAVARAINEIELTAAMFASAKVELRRAGAETRIRDLEVAVMRQGNSSQSMRRYAFLAPSDIRGTKLLVHENAQKANNLWLLLPSVGKPRQVSASKQSNFFAGTDFSYANLMAMNLDRFSHAITESSGKSVTLESTVASKSYANEIGYFRSVTQASAGSFVPSRVDYYDAKGNLLKTQEMASPAKTPDGKVILQSRHMIVHGEGRETLIQLSNIDFNPRLGAVDFKSQSL